MNERRLGFAWRVLAGLVLLLTGSSLWAQEVSKPRSLAPLPKFEKAPDPGQAKIGELLFFDPRLSGDATTSCATCHNPKHNWSDGLPMAKGYPGTLYFRNTPTVVNASLGSLMYWDGRLPVADMDAVIRDHISEAHFMQADGRLVIERTRQIPEYEAAFKESFGGEPTYGRILKSVKAYLQTLRSADVPFDRYLAGDETAMSDAAIRGHKLFIGKAACIRCHDGAMLTDGKHHSLGLTTNRDVFREPLRHVTFRRFFRTLGVPNFDKLQQDPGLYCISKSKRDVEQMRTPTLRELVGTEPYMHDGQLPTLEAVVEFYNAGGGPRESRSPLLKPLNLTKDEQTDLVEFLKALSGKPIVDPKVEVPGYQLRKLGEN